MYHVARVGQQQHVEHQREDLEFDKRGGDGRVASQQRLDVKGTTGVAMGAWPVSNAWCRVGAFSGTGQDRAAGAGSVWVRVRGEGESGREREGGEGRERQGPSARGGRGDGGGEPPSGLTRPYSALLRRGQAAQ